MMEIKWFRKISVTLVLILAFSKVSSKNSTFEVSPASIIVYKDLLSTLQTNYDTKVRPRKNQSETVEVNTTFTLQSIINFDTTGQRIDVMGFFTVTWYDEEMTWDPTDYNNTKFIKLPLSSIWYPKLGISKTFDKSAIIGDSTMDAVDISYDGLITWIPDGIYNSVCKVSVKYYPFDDQTCELVYFVSDEILSTVQLNGPPTIILDDFMDNSEWDLLDVSVTVTEKYSNNFVKLQCRIQRRADFTVYTMIIPLCTLALINIFTFLIPIESGEKGSLAITLFLAYGFFVTITRDALPHNSLQVSYYIIYITVLMTLSVFTVIYVIIESKIYSTLGTKKVRICTRKFGKVNVSQTDIQLEKATETKAMPKIEQHSNDTVTWSEMLSKIDFVSFCASFIFVLFFSIALWSVVSIGE